ncbi:MAG: hypothetical protein RDU20_20200, partial [Desulfomonilaceae bacterium]|nr:hypothetical protein [Desulfomonilaceae bacterium]
MKDQDKTKAQLINELEKLRRRVSELEELSPESQQSGDPPHVWREQMPPDALRKDDVTETLDLTKILT